MLKYGLTDLAMMKVISDRFQQVKNKAIGLFKDELGEKNMIEFVGPREKIYTYLTDDDSEHKKAQGTKISVIKQGLMFKSYKDWNFNNKTIPKSQQRFKSDHHNAYTEQINKIALSSNDNKRLQTFGKITTYPYETNAFKVCESEFRRNSLKKDVDAK